MSIFKDKRHKPMVEELRKRLGKNYKLWQEINTFVLQTYEKGLKEWNFPGKKYGWNYRIKNKKRAILYLIPKKNYFKAAFVFGQKAIDEIMKSDISENIKTELKQAKKYAEGRGIRIDVKDKVILPDIKQLVKIKLAN